MERLTFEGNFCDISKCAYLMCPYDHNCTQKQVWERLKDYEDAGLSPQACAEAREIEETLSSYDYSISRMVELMKADKDGRLVVLPVRPVLTQSCASMLYIVDDDEIYEDSLDKAVVGMSSSGRTNVIYTTLSDQMIFGQEAIGKTVFLTREEAEKALQAMKGETEK
nr:MAG TPA: hypothetical protein [Caudoviricetes sp.]